MVDSGQISTSRACRVRSSKRSTVPPTAAVAGAARPDDVVVDRIGNRPAALAAGDRVPHAARNRSGRFPRPTVSRAGCCSGRASKARPAGCRRRCTESGCRWSTWYICATGSWNWCQLLPRLTDTLIPSSCATMKRSPLVGSIHMSWLSPIGARRPERSMLGLAAVERLGELRGQEVGLVLVVRLDREARVVMRPAAQAPVGADQLPVLAAIVAAPERAALRRRAIGARQAVAGLNQRIHAIRVAARDLRRRSSRPAASADRVRRAASTSRRRRPICNRPLPFPPLVLPHVWISSCHIPANRIRGLRASIAMSAQPVFSSTKSVRCQVLPPSAVRNTPRSCCGP